MLQLPWSDELLNERGPLTYQKELAELVVEKKLQTVFETGVHNGVSTVCLLSALREVSNYHRDRFAAKEFIYTQLLSCENRFRNEFDLRSHVNNIWGKNFDQYIEEGLWTPLSMTGVVGLKAYTRKLEEEEELPRLSLFLHDSLHTEKNMREEMELAWPLIEPGGYMAIDDWELNSAFEDFCKDYKLDHYYGISTCALIQKR